MATFRVISQILPFDMGCMSDLGQGMVSSLAGDSFESSSGSWAIAGWVQP